jgi:hypothetical protein
MAKSFSVTPNFEESTDRTSSMISLDINKESSSSMILRIAFSARLPGMTNAEIW